MNSIKKAKFVNLFPEYEYGKSQPDIKNNGFTIVIGRTRNTDDTKSTYINHDNNWCWCGRQPCFCEKLFYLLIFIMNYTGLELMNLSLAPGVKG